MNTETITPIKPGLNVESQLLQPKSPTFSSDVKTNEDEKYSGDAGEDGNKSFDLTDGEILTSNDMTEDVEVSDANPLLSLEDIQASVSAAGMKFLQNTKPTENSAHSAIHKDILEEILEALEPIDFARLAGLSPGEKLSQKHTVVLTVKEVMRVAKDLRCDLCRNGDFIYSYNGQYWSLLEPEQLQQFLGEASEGLGVDHVTASYHKYREQLFKQFLTIANLPKPQTSNNLCLINLANGTFEVREEGYKVRPFQSDDFLTYQLPFDYDENADCPRWLAFLDEVLPDKTRQDLLAEYFGYIFSGLKLEKTLLLLGAGANGKSVVFDVIGAVLGEQNISNYSLSSLKREYERAMLVNKLLNYASEISTRVEADIFKKLSSGEPCEARLPYGKPFIMRKYAKLAFNCNELPREIEHTDAFFRRFLIIKFDVTIPENKRNPNLSKEIIADELSGIFNWVLAGLKRLIQQGNFSHSPAAKTAVEEYRRESDSVALFLEEASYRKVADRDDATLLKSIYGDYKLFCHDYNFRPVHVQTFSNRLRALEYECQRTNKGVLVYAQKFIPIDYEVELDF